MLITILVCAPIRGTFACPWNIAVRTRGVFTHRAGFQKLACAKRGLVRTASQLFSGKLGANHITNAKTARQPRHQSWQNRISSNKSRAPTESPPSATPRANHLTTRRLHQRFLYCDGETPNISLKYFAKYFCVPKPTASETSTTLSPASADNSWAALLSRMVRMNTEGFIP